MSSFDSKSATRTGSPLLWEPQNGGASDSASFSAANNKDEIEPQALILLREFFLLLDQWDQQQGPRKEGAT